MISPSLGYDNDDRSRLLLSWVGKILIELRHLRYFLAVAQTMNFTRAAEFLYVSQPTLSQQIKQLEAELGTTLFDRVGKRVMLTEAGEMLQVYGQQMLVEMENAQSAIQELEGLQRGELTVGVSQMVNAYMVPDLVARFTTSHPAISLCIQEHVDFVDPTSPLIQAEPLFDEKLVLVVPKAHRLALQQQIHFDELDNEPLIVLSSSFYSRQVTEESLKAVGARSNFLVEMNSIQAVLATVRAKGAAAVLPTLALRLKDGEGLCSVQLAELGSQLSVCLLWRRDGYRRVAARAFAAMAVALSRDDFLPLTQVLPAVGMTCPHCHSTQLSKNGHKLGKQRYLCKACGRQFGE